MQRGTAWTSKATQVTPRQALATRPGGLSWLRNDSAAVPFARASQAHPFHPPNPLQYNFSSLHGNRVQSSMHLKCSISIVCTTLSSYSNVLRPNTCAISLLPPTHSWNLHPPAPSTLASTATFFSSKNPAKTYSVHSLYR